MIIREFTLADHSAAFTIWQNTKGVCNCDKCMTLDKEEEIARFILRNPGMSFVAEQDGEVIGTVLAGHDGRTGIIYRLTVAEKIREKGIGKALVENAVKALKNEGLTTIKAFVLNDNDIGNIFWEKIGFKENDMAVTRVKRI
ncbi:MAG: GNAT family N-acetyltransferase [Oscillospiraceae bacterium]|nr:GNAT family N-acetyltransferase [Oscillospiraceae bacterium]